MNNRKVCLITGANSGLGLAAAINMAAQGVHIIMVCRDSQKTSDAVTKIRDEVSKASIEVIYCDLASLNEVKNCIRQVKDNHSRLDVLYNNAAVVKLQRTLTPDNLEMMFQVNYLAPYLLTTSLLPELKNSPDGRVINISFPPPEINLDLNDLQSEHAYQFFQVFFKSKLCLLLFTIEFARRNSDSSVSIFATDPGPGGFKSKLLRELPMTTGDVSDVLKTTPEKAAETISYLAFSEEVKSKSGSLFSGREQVAIPSQWQDTALCEQLWKISEELSHP